jgi:hypothetical protein
VLALAGFCVIVYPLSLWLYGRAVDVGREYGTLAGYWGSRRRRAQVHRCRVGRGAADGRTPLCLRSWCLRRRAAGPCGTLPARPCGHHPQAGHRAAHVEGTLRHARRAHVREDSGGGRRPS